MTEVSKPQGQTTPASPRKAIDWEAVEREYRAGIRSLKDIGSEFGCSDAAIIKRARRDGWVRDLKAKIQAKAEAKVRAAAVSAEVSAQTKTKEAAVVEANAELVYTVLMRQRGHISRAMQITAAMLEELESATEKKAPLAKRAPIAKQLTEALRIQVQMERQAFGVASDEAGDGPKNPLVDLIGELMKRRSAVPIVGEE